MVERKDFPIKISYNLEEVKKQLRETRKVLEEQKKIEESYGTLPKAITSKQKKGLNQRIQAKTGRSPFKDTKSAGPTAGITPDSIITKQQNEIKRLQEEQKKAAQKQKELEAEQKRIQKEREKREKEQEKYRAGIQKQLEKEENKRDNQIAQIRDNLFDPIGFFRGAGIGALNNVVPVAFISTIYGLIYDRLQKEFGPGGRFDLRKLVLDQVFDYLQIPKRIARDRGTVHFASLHSEPVYQGAPGFSNTERIADGHLRDILISPGR